MLLKFAPKNPTLRDLVWSCQLQKEFHYLLKLKQHLHLNPDVQKSRCKCQIQVQVHVNGTKFLFLLLKPIFFTRSEEVRLGLGSAGAVPKGRNELPPPNTHPESRNVLV